MVGLSGQIAWLSSVSLLCLYECQNLLMLAFIITCYLIERLLEKTPIALPTSNY